MAQTLYLDCFSGISGDMCVGALCDLGASVEKIAEELRKLSLGEMEIRCERQTRQGISGTKFIVDDGQRDHQKDEHHHGHSYAEIRALLGASALSEFVRRKSLALFERIAIAEGKIHGLPVDQVGFHEVGAVDSIADMVAVCVALEELGQPCVFVSPLREGRGWIDCAHGRFPLPAPATLEILRGLTIEQVDENWESITPTGAAIVAELAKSSGAMPRMKIERVGYGIGTRDLPSRPNVLRAVLGETEDSLPNELGNDTIVEIETNLDDLSPEISGAMMERLLTLGALDVTLASVQMKKNRPGVQLSVLCAPALEDKIVRTLLTETSAFGVRRSEKRRFKLERRFEKVQTAFGEISIKIGLLAGEVVQVAPEFESCREASEKTQQPLRRIYQAALAAYEATR